MRPILALLLATAAPLAAHAQPAPAPKIAPLDFTQRTLANGLRVYALRDTTTPNVSIQVWYDVGSKDDPAGRSGFAHMFEHLMFKATRNLVAENFDRLTEDVGGYNNASTNDDYTNYYEVVPANHLQRLLFAEADRMSALVVEPVSFASERAVVEEELRQSTLAQPYGKLLSIDYPAVSYSVHPYARATIGSINNLESAGIDDVRAFHATYYRPDNAILVVSGNFDPAQLDGWVDQYFAPIARPGRPIPRVTVAEPERTAPTHYTVYEPNTPLPAVLISWHVPPDNDPDNAALEVLKAILANGESSRLYQHLVYRDQLAQSTDAFVDSRKQTGNFVLYAILAGGKTAAAGEAALRREVAALRDAPVSQAELDKARTAILTSSLRERETAEGKASALAAAVIIDGDPRAPDRQLADIAALTPADIQRVARRYLADTGSATIHYLPQEMANGAKSDVIALAPTIVTSPLERPADLAIVTPASAADRILPPPPGAPVQAAIPQAVETRLPNGLRVITVEKHGLPLVTARLIATRGATADRPGKAGTASLSADLLTKGTATRSATQIAQGIETLGGTLDSDAGNDGAAIDVTVTTASLAPVLDVMADVALHPAFTPQEIARARAQAIDAANVTVKDPAQLARLVAARATFGTGPYGAATDGTPASLAAITRADLTTAWKGTWQPDQSALVLVGDITTAEAQALATARFGGWWRTTPAAPALAPATRFPAPRVIVVDIPGAGQAGVVVERPGITRNDPLFYAAAVANAVLGGGFSSRLNQEIRIKRGLAYGASSGLAGRRLGGAVLAYTQTKNPSAPEVIALITQSMQAIGTHAAPDAAELETRKATLTGSFGRDIETTDGMASALADRIILGVPLSELPAYPQAIQAVTPAQAKAAAATLLDPKPASIIVVGDASQFVAELRKAYPALELIPATALKLDSPALR